MTTPPITDATNVRTIGALNAPTVASGAASDNQVNAAIYDAQMRMVQKVGITVYAAVQAFDDADLEVPANADKQNAFIHAESCFAIAELCHILTAQQLSDTGIIQTVEVGKYRQNFTTSDEPG